MQKLNKQIWIMFPVGIHEEISDLSKNLGLTVSEFIRNATYTQLVLIQQQGLGALTLGPTPESSIKKFLIQKGGQK